MEVRLVFLSSSLFLSFSIITCKVNNDILLLVFLLNESVVSWAKLTIGLFFHSLSLRYELVGPQQWNQTPFFLSFSFGVKLVCLLRHPADTHRPLLYKRGTPASFHLFSSFRTENLSSQQDSNSDCRSRRQERWPLDHHHGPMNVGLCHKWASPDHCGLNEWKQKVEGVVESEKGGTYFFVNVCVVCFTVE